MNEYTQHPLQLNNYRQTDNRQTLRLFREFELRIVRLKMIQKVLSHTPSRLEVFIKK